MYDRIELLTPLEVFHDLHGVVDTRRKVVKIDRDVLANLLIDYTRMLNALQHTNMKIRTEPPKRRREVINK